jgi:hypothetical protein
MVKKGVDTKATTIYFPVDILERLEKFCKNHPYGADRSKVTSTAVKELLDKEEKS